MFFGSRLINQSFLCVLTRRHRLLYNGTTCAVCGDDVICDDPHMTGLRGQKIDWSGVNGGWYSLIKDSKADLHINIRLTAPLPEEFPNRQLVTGVSVLAAGHSLAIEVKNPYTTATDGCPTDVSPCLANGGLRAVVDGYDVEDLLHFSRRASVAGNTILVSASNLPVECRQVSTCLLFVVVNRLERGTKLSCLISDPYFVPGISLPFTCLVILHLSPTCERESYF